MGDSSQGHPKDTKVIFGHKEAKMLAMILSLSMSALVAGSALPHPEMPPLQERGECMAWSWSSATGWKCTQEISTDPVDLDKFRQDSLAAHNAYRAKHGVAALKLSSELNALAQEWADHLIAENAFEHRPNNNNGEDMSLAISPRWCGKAALRLELASPRKEARWWLWRTILPPATISASMLTTFLHPSRGAKFNNSLDF